LTRSKRLKQILTVCGKSKLKKTQYIVEIKDKIYYKLCLLEISSAFLKCYQKYHPEKKMKRKRTLLKIDALGFTLIELMVVIVIS